jgi:hypothetical protein
METQKLFDKRVVHDNIPTIDYLISQADQYYTTITSVKWKGNHYAILLMSDLELSPEETILQMQDLLRNTQEEHEARGFETMAHAILYNPSYNFWGSSVVCRTKNEASTLASIITKEAFN